MRASCVCQVAVVLVGVAALLSVPALAVSRAAPSQGLIVFTSSRDGGSSLYAVRPDGTHLTRLLAHAEAPRISPDGSSVAFNTPSLNLEVLELPSGKRHPLSAPGFDLNGWVYWPYWPWAPDGSRLVVGSDEGIFVFRADGSGARQITNDQDSQPAWSPDGNQIAFSRFSGGLYVTRADGTGLRRIAKDGDSPQWSPDGRSIAYGGGSLNMSLFVVPAAGGSASKIAASDDFSWSPDSPGTLAVADLRRGLALYRSDGTLERTLLKGKRAESPTWSPDGTSVVAVVDGDLWRFPRDGGRAARLTQGWRYGYWNGGPSWSRQLPPKLSGVAVSPATRFGGPLVAVSRANGRPSAGFPRVSGAGRDGDRSVIYSVIGDGRGGWYIGGDFAAIGAVDCPNLAHIMPNRTVDPGWCPKPNGPIRSLARTATTLFVGGENLTSIAGAPRGGLAAFDTTSGRLTGWSPRVRADGQAEVDRLALDPSNQTVYFAGIFDSVGGVARSNFAAVNARSGQVTAFAPDPDAPHGETLDAFVVTRSHVYSWGPYSQIGGKPSSGGTAQLDKSSGGLLDLLTDYYLYVRAATVSGGRVLVGGKFTRFDGQPRQGLASFNDQTVTVDAWAPAVGPKRDVQALTLSGSLLFAAINVGNGPAAVAAYDTTSGKRIWQAGLTLSASSDLVVSAPVMNTIAASSDLVVLGGDFTAAHL